MNNSLLIKRFSSSEKFIPEEWNKIATKNKLIKKETPKILILSGNMKSINKDFEIYSESRLIFYVKNQDVFINLEEFNESFFTKNIVEEILHGNLIPITDSSFCIYEETRDKLFLFSSCCGSSTIYFTKINNDSIFVSHTDYLSKLKKYSISNLGLSEIVRFGANYSSGTIFKELKRIPFSSVLISESNNCYLLGSYYPNVLSLKIKNIEVSDLLKKVISSYQINKYSILFSAGIDSTVISEISNSLEDVALYYMKHSADDKTDIKFIEEIEQKKRNVNTFTYERDFEEFVNTIRAYSLPTLDFSILPTLQILSKSSKFSKNIFDGLGGDSGFGFPEIKNIKTWNKLKNLNFINQISSKILLKLFSYGFYIRNINYILFILARLSFSKYPEISQFACNPYSFSQLKTTKKDWKNIEIEMIDVIDSCLGKNKVSNEIRYVIAHNCLENVVPMAKTGQSILRENIQVFYPFYHPLVISYALKYVYGVKKFFSKELGFKPILKKFLLNKGLSFAFVTRQKVGFQPPLKEILLDNKYKQSINKILNEDSPYLDKYFSKEFLKVIKKKNYINKCKTIKELYLVWSYLSIKVWLRNFSLV